MGENIDIFGSVNNRRVNITSLAQKLIRRAKSAYPEMMRKADSIASKVDGKVVKNELNIKSKESLIRKMQADGTIPKDILRTTIIVEQDNHDKALSLIRKEASKYSTSRVKIQKAEDNNGYSGTIVNFTARNGMVYEIQLNTPEMIYAKEKLPIAYKILGKKKMREIFTRFRGTGAGMGHKYYEELRIRNKAEKKNKTDRRTKGLKQRSQDYYRIFRNK